MPQISKNLLEQREENCDGGFEPGEFCRQGLYEHNQENQVEINFWEKDDLFFNIYLFTYFLKKDFIS